MIVGVRELIKLNQRMDRMETLLVQALTLPDKLQALTDRVVSLETERAVRDARGGVLGKGLDALWALLLAFIAAGVWFK